MKHSLAGACFLLYNENTIWQGGKTILPIYRQYKNIETEPLKGPKFRKPRTETQKRWDFALCSLRRLLSDLRPKLARAACSNKGLRSDAMLAHKANSNVSAFLYAVSGTSDPFVLFP